MNFENKVISREIGDILYASGLKVGTAESCTGGRIAEAMELDDITTGASNDIQRATGIARDMVAKYGMSGRIGTVSYESGSEIFVGRDYEKTKSYSEQTAGEIDAEVKAIVDEAYRKCSAILEEHRDQLRAVAEYLLAHNTMDRTQFEACMEGREIPEVSGSSLFDTFTDNA
ncbi:MAG: CinA family protein [Prevotella sp.]|nr:CinA family protein [Prevotella sp.]